MLRVLEDHKDLPWEDQAKKFLEKLVGFDYMSQGAGECAQSLYLQACHDLLKTGKGKDDQTFYYSCGDQAIPPSEFPVKDWNESPVEFPFGNNPKSFKICSPERLQILID